MRDRPGRRTRRRVLGVAWTGAGALAACALPGLPGRERRASTRRAARFTVLYVPSFRLTEALEQGARAATQGSGGRYEVVLEQAPPGPPPIPGGDGQPMTLPPGSPLLSALHAGAASGAATDIVVLHRPDEIGSLLGEGMVQGVGQYVRSQGKEAREALDGFSAGALEGLRHRGELYGVPLSATAEVLSYDPRLFDAAGLTRPSRMGAAWTRDAFLDAVRRLTKDLDGDGVPDQYALASMGSVEGWIWRAGGEILSPDGRRSLVAEPAAVEAIAEYAQLRASGFPRPGAYRPPSQATPDGYFLGEPPHAPRVAMLIGSPSAAARINWPLLIAELPRWRRQATALRLEAAVALSAGAREPAAAYAALLSLAVETQPFFPTPARAPAVAQLQRSLEATGGSRWDDDEAEALVNSLRSGRSLPLVSAQAVKQALTMHVTGPVAQGQKTPEQAARDAAAAIDEILRAKHV